MIIGMDAKRAVANYTGLGNYSRLTIDLLASARRNNNFHLFIPSIKENEKFDKLLKHENVMYSLPSTKIGKLCGGLWRSWRIIHDIRVNGIQIYHGLSNELPLGIRSTGVKSIVTIHDLIFRRHPEFYPIIDRHIYNVKFRYACKKADRIIAVSECTKNDIIKYYGIDENKIDVVYQGCDSSFDCEVDSSAKAMVRERYNLPEKFILNVGSIEARKNILQTIKALPRLDSEVKLVIVGRPTSYMKKLNWWIDSLELHDRVLFLHDVPSADLPALYQCAKLFVYPSLYEGFGIPILEALHSRVPVIAATGSCLAEAGGPGSVYVDPGNVTEMKETIEKLWNDDAKCQTMIELGKIYARKFDESQQVDSLLKCYNKALMDYGRKGERDLSFRTGLAQATI